MNSKKKKEMYTLIFVALSAFLSAFAYQSFAGPGNLYPAGFMGLAVLLSRLCERYLDVAINFNLIYFVLNAAATILVLRVAGRRFLAYSILQYLLTSLFIAVFPPLSISGDIMLLAIFGGALAGLSCALALKAGASSGGSDFLAIYFSSRQNSPAWFLILYLNWFILLAAGVHFGMREALYSIIYQTIATYVINQMHDRYKLANVQIITTKAGDMLPGIFDVASHGVTVFQAECGYSHEGRTVIMMIVNNFEAERIVGYANGIDGEAFISVSKVNRVRVNYIQPKLD